MGESSSVRGRELSPVLGVVVVAVSVAIGALVMSGGRPRPAPAGLPDPGLATAWLLPVARVGMDVGAVGTIGCLLAAAFLIRARDGALLDAGRRSMQAAGRCAGAWLVASAALAVLTVCDVVGVRPTELLTSRALMRYAWQLPETRALVTMAFVALIVALNARTVRSRLGAMALLVLAMLGTAPLLLAGHSAAAASHYVATQALLVHVLAATVWVGGLFAMTLLLRGDPDELRFVVPRFSALALVCFVVVALSGSVTAWTRLGLAPAAWWSPYGALIGGKTVLLVVLGVLGWLHRRRTVAAVVSGRVGAFWRLALVEVLVMAGTVALAVVLARTAPPVGGGLAVDAPHASRFATVDGDLARFEPLALLTRWDPDALVITVLTVVAAGQLLALRGLHRRGLSWPVPRIVCSTVGLGVVLLALCGGVASYASAMLSMQVAQLLTMLVMAPMLLAAGRPVELVRAALGSAPQPRTARWADDPVNGLILVFVLLLGAYRTPLLELSLSIPVVHLLVNVAALAVGMTFFRAVIGRDGLTDVRNRFDRAVLTLLFGLSLVALGAWLWRLDGPVAAGWFADLRLRWSHPGEDRQHAAVVAAMFALPLLSWSVSLIRPVAQSRGSSSVPSDRGLVRTTR